MNDHDTSETDTASPVGTQLSVPILVRSLHQGSSVAIAVTAPRFSTYGAAPAALDALWRYREMVRSLEELEIGDVLPLDEAIPELGKRGPSGDR
jgi:hypothetical protein